MPADREALPRLSATEDAAKALHGWESGKDSVNWEAEDEFTREQVRDAARTVLDAAGFPTVLAENERLRALLGRAWRVVGNTDLANDIDAALKEAGGAL